MNFSRFPPKGVFDYMRRDPAPPVTAGAGIEADTGPGSGGGGAPAGAARPAGGAAGPSQILTRPRAGASIINGVAPGPNVGQPGAQNGEGGVGTGPNGEVAAAEEKQKVRSMLYGGSYYLC